MIKLNKLPEPAILTQNKAKWTQDLLQATDPKPSLKNKYNHPEIKEALRQETHGKCAYCENSFLASSYGDIEHIHPKSLHPHRSFEWENLTFSCTVCNTNKGNMDINADNFVDPYQQNPEDYFEFNETIISEKNNNIAAKTMIDKLQLNRRHLEHDRRLVLEKLDLILESLIKPISIEAKLAIKSSFLEDTAEYAMMLRSAFKSRGGDALCV